MVTRWSRCGHVVVTWWSLGGHVVVTLWSRGGHVETTRIVGKVGSYCVQVR